MDGASDPRLAIQVVVVWNDRDTLESCFLKSRGLERVHVSLIDNQHLNRSLPSIFNELKRQAASDWMVFCHQDLILLSDDWPSRLVSLPADACYGPIGMDLDGNFRGQIVQTDGSVQGRPGRMDEVQTVDELCFIVPRAIASQVDFDERFAFHFYAHDYCLAAKQHGFSTRIAPIECQHKSKTLTGDLSSEVYLSAKALFLDKYSAVTPLCTSTFQVWPKYWGNVENDETLKVEFDFVKAGSNVLEIGAAAGFMTRSLIQKGCTVTALEIDRVSARALEEICPRVIVGDVETLDLKTLFGAERFDTIMLGDVVEHLREPAPVLRQLRGLLRDDGQLVISMPNVAHAAIRLTLLNGQFDYSRIGLLDGTHVHLYTLSSVVELFKRCSYLIRDLHRTRRSFFATEIRVPISSLSPAVIRAMCVDQDFSTYQFVFRAVPSDDSSQAAADLRDPTWSEERGINEAAAACSFEGWRLFHYGDRADLATARKCFAMAFRLKPTAKTAMYWTLVTLAPASVLDYVRSAYIRRDATEKASVSGSTSASGSAGARTHG